MKHKNVNTDLFIVGWLFITISFFTIESDFLKWFFAGAWQWVCMAVYGIIRPQISEDETE